MDELSGIKVGESVLAIVQQDNHFRSIELRKRGRFLEILSHSETQKEETWLSFAQQTGVLDASGRRVHHRHEKVVLGLASVGVSFYKMTLPNVSPEETDAMVRLQVETRLPLPVEEMAIDWKTVAVEQDQSTVAVVAARRSALLPHADQVKRLEPHAVYLEAEALVQTWKWFFNEDSNEGMILSCNTHHTVVCSVRGGQLIQAAVLDSGIEELSLSLSKEESELEEGHLGLEQFVQDLEGLLLLFDADLSKSSRIMLLSDGSDALHTLAQAFVVSGLDVTEVLPEKELLTGRHTLESRDLYAYRVPIGLALCELDTSTTCFKLFDDVCHRPDQQRSAWMTPWRAGVMAAVAVFIMTSVLYGIDIMRHRQLSRLTETPEVRQFQQEQAYQKIVAQHRPNLLELIDVLSSQECKGIVLDTLYFKQGEPIKITGRADQPEQWYEFEKALTQLKYVSQVKPDKLVKDEKDNNKVKFSVSFHYKTFTKRSALK